MFQTKYYSVISCIINNSILLLVKIFADSVPENSPFKLYIFEKPKYFFLQSIISNKTLPQKTFC